MAGDGENGKDLEKAMDADAKERNISQSPSDPSRTNLTTDKGASPPYGSYLAIFQVLIGISTPPDILNAQIMVADILSNAPADVLSSQGELTNRNNIALPSQTQKQSELRKQRTGLVRSFFPRAVANSGCYGSALDQELRSSIGFQTSKHLINILYIIQILVAATITAISAYEGYRAALTTLGAINTVLAGLTALVKGQGLPNRLLRCRDSMRNIIQRIEETERLFASYRYAPSEIKDPKNPWDEATALENLYRAAMKDQQANYPDVYVDKNERAAMTAINESNRGGSTLAPGGNITAQEMKRMQEILSQLNNNTQGAPNPLVSDSSPPNPTT